MEESKITKWNRLGWFALFSFMLGLLTFFKSCFGCSSISLDDKTLNTLINQDSIRRYNDSLKNFYVDKDIFLKLTNSQNTIVGYGPLSMTQINNRSEFYFMTESDSVVSIDVFSNNQFGCERIYHDEFNTVDNNGMYDYGFLPITLNGIDFILRYEHGGSGRYLYFDLFKFDGVKSLVIAYTEGGIPDGQFVPKNNTLIVRGGSKVYQLSLENNKIKKEYLKDLPTTLGNGMHILSIESNKSSLIPVFDSESLDFRKIEAERFIATRPIKLKIGEVVYWDKNTSGKKTHDIRFFNHQTTLKEEPGVSRLSLKPVRTGKDTVMISIDYGDWFEIPIEVVN